MKKILVTSFLLTGLSPLMAASSVEFLQNGFGAKSAGLGNAYGVVVQDPSALYWNPAGLAQIYSEKRITQTVDAVRDGKALADDEEFNKLLEDQNTSGTPDSKTVEITERSTQVQFNASGSMLSNGRMLYFGGAAVTLGNGALGAGYGGSRVADVKGYDSTGNPTGNALAMSHVAYLGYGWGAGPLRLGISGFAIREDLAGQSVSGGGVNIGAQMVVLPPLLAVAADIKNLAFVDKAGGNSALKSVGKLDTLFSFSMQIQAPPPNSNFKLILGFTANLDKPAGDGVNLNMGLAYGFNRYMYAMLGLNGSKPAVGLGVNIGKTFQLALSANRDVMGKEFQYFGELNFAF